jgi:hypothetical protein
VSVRMSGDDQWQKHTNGEPWQVEYTALGREQLDNGIGGTDSMRNEGLGGHYCFMLPFFF